VLDCRDLDIGRVATSPRSGPGFNQRLLEICDRVADLDIDPAMTGNRCLQVDLKVMVFQTNAAGQQQLADIGLDVRFGPHPAPIGQAPDKVLELTRKRFL
jgi:hypothetical protein